MLISTSASNLRFADNKVTYQVTKKLKGVVADGVETYIYFSTGEEYIVELEIAKEAIDKIDKYVTLKLSINFDGKRKVEHVSISGVSN